MQHTVNIFLVRGTDAEGNPNFQVWDFEPTGGGKVLLSAKKTVSFDLDDSLMNDQDALLAERLAESLEELKAKHSIEQQRVQESIDKLLALPAPKVD